jgi:predicted helicase
MPAAHAVKPGQKAVKSYYESLAAYARQDVTLGGIPPEVFDYRLGNRSALDWVIDQYPIKTDKRSGIISDPNRPDDPEYIIRLVGQVVRVSMETVKIVNALPEDFGGGKAT